MKTHLLQFCSDLPLCIKSELHLVDPFEVNDFQPETQFLKLKKKKKNINLLL